MTRRDWLYLAQDPGASRTEFETGRRDHASPAWRVVMNRKLTFAATVVGLALGATSTAIWTLSSGVVLGQSQQSVKVPKFQYDPSFPQPLPEKWAIGAIGGMAVDSHDHIWVLHRPGPLQKNERFAGAAMTPPRADCCIPAPPVLEFDQDGKLLASWGGPRRATSGRRPSTASLSM